MANFCGNHFPKTKKEIRPFENFDQKTETEFY